MLQYLINKYNNLEIAKKILNMLIVTAVLPIIIIVVITSSIVANTILSQTDDFVKK